MNILHLKPIAEKLFSDIGEMSFDGSGITRDSYGDGESGAIEYLTKFACEQGLLTEVDAAANVTFFSPKVADTDLEIWIGSHLDSVPKGGNFDGLAGVVAGLLCLIAQREDGNAAANALKVLGFRGEESAWFGKAYVGSSAALGKLTKADLELTHRATGQSLAHCMTGVGARIDRIEMQEPLLDIGKARAYFELHIEQGPVMVAKAIPLGVVPGIRGNTRHNKIICIGEAGHSGAVPRWLRHDAVLAVSELLSRMDEHWRELLQRGDDLVITAGIFSTDPAEHAISRIPGFVNFSFEARSKDAKTLENVYKLMRAECERIAIDRGVRFEFDRRLEAAPAVMDPQLCALLSESCRRNNISYEAVPSGAGHDASLFANAGVPTGMLFVRNEHGSHNPAEAMDINDFMLGVQVLFDVVSHL